MPIITEETVERKEEGGVCGPVEMLRFSDTGGLTQFGAYVEILPPGSSSSVKHWHSDEDEMIYLIEGDLLLHEGDAKAVLHAGQAATFKAGDPVGHVFENVSDRPARYVVIGTRAERDRVTYPDDNRVLEKDRTTGRSVWTDLDGNPADNPYDG